MAERSAVLLARSMALVHRAGSAALPRSHPTLLAAYTDLQLDAANVRTWLAEHLVVTDVSELERIEKKLRRISDMLDALDLWCLEHPIGTPYP